MDSILKPPGSFVMMESESDRAKAVSCETAPLSDTGRYERACDEAIALCDGNMRSTIKALLMANEYLEMELRDLQAARHDGNLASSVTDDAA